MTTSRRLNVSFFASTTSTMPELAFGLTWPELVARLGPPRSYVAKDAAPLYSPAEWLPGKTRGKDGVVAIHFGVLDLDHWRAGDIVGLVEDLRRKGLAYYLVSTWSNGSRSPEDACGRLLVPFSRPVLPSEWSSLWGVLNDRLARGMADPRCKDVSRSYYLPSFQEGSSAPPFHDAALEGEPVDIDTLLRGRGADAGVRPPAVPGAPAPAAGGGIDRWQLKEVATTYSKSENHYKAFIGQAMLRVLRGEMYAREPGTIGSIFETGGVVLPEGRNDTTYKVVAKICEHFPHAEPQAIGDLFAPSVALMGSPEVHEVVSMAERLLAESKQAHAHKIFEVLGRYEPYTDEELALFAQRAEISVATLRQRWIVQRDRTYYVLRPEGYRAFSESEIENAAAFHLAPAIRAGVDTQKLSMNGAKNKTIKELVHDYGTIAAGTIIDLTAQQTHYDEATQMVIEAPCPVRVKPYEHPEIDTWLRHLAKGRYEKLIHWLAALLALDEPCAALYLEGPPGVGKSLLGYGVARIWTTEGPTMMGEVMGNWNERLAKCPLVFGDEKAPVDARGRVQTDALREFIQARDRPFKRRFKDTATIRGCARVIFAANNRNLLETSDHLTENDIAAIVERILYVPVHQDAREYLASLPQGTAQDWVYGDAMAEHALWLSQTVQVPRTGRFLVSGEASDLTNALSVGTGLRSSVCQWLVGYLTAPQRIQQKPSLLPLVCVSDGRLCVRAKAIAEAWAEYVHHDFQPPSPWAVSRALGGLSRDLCLRTADNPATKFKHVDMNLLAEWAEQTGYATREDLDRQLRELEARGRP